MGALVFTMTEQIADTIRAHGRDWATWHYTQRRAGPRLSAMEWAILSRGAA